LILPLILAASARGATLFDLVSSNPDLSRYAQILKNTGVDATLNGGSGQYTVFAPTNEAFDTPPMASFKLKYLQANQDKLKAFAEYTIVNSVVKTGDMYTGQKLATLEGDNLFPVVGSPFRVDDATCGKGYLSTTDESASNGYLNIVNVTYIPPSLFPNDVAFFGEQRSAGRIGFNGFDCRLKGTTILSSGEYKPVGLAIDSDAQIAFWSNDANANPFDSWLTRINFDGTDKQILFNTKLYDPQGMSVDTKSKKLYFTEHQGRTVSVCDYDGTNRQMVLQADAGEYPSTVAVDPDLQLIFIQIESGDLTNGKLVMMRYNQTGVQTRSSDYKTVVPGPLIKNFGICLDKRAKNLYYVLGGNDGSINCLSYAPGNPCPKAKPYTQLQYPYYCDVDTTFAPYGGPTYIMWSETQRPGSTYVGIAGCSGTW